MGWDKGKVDGKPAQVKEDGKRVEAIYNFRAGGVHDKIVTNDGVNADYVREGGKVIVNEPRQGK
jgi:hypothetical protein